MMSERIDRPFFRAASARLTENRLIVSSPTAIDQSGKRPTSELFFSIDVQPLCGHTMTSLPRRPRRRRPAHACHSRLPRRNPFNRTEDTSEAAL